MHSLSVKLLIKYPSNNLDPFDEIFSIADSVKYTDETVELKVGSGHNLKILELRNNDINKPQNENSFDINIHYTQDGNVIYLCLEVPVASADIDIFRERLFFISDLLDRYLIEWVKKHDAAFASIHTSLDPLNVDNVNEDGFPMELGWVTYFGGEFCALFGMDKLTGAKIGLYTAYNPTNSKGVHWRTTFSIFKRWQPSQLQIYLNNYQFRYLQLVEEAHHRTVFTLDGGVSFTAEAKDEEHLVSIFESILGVKLEQYKDLWDRVEGWVFGLKISLNYHNDNGLYDCSLLIIDTTIPKDYMFDELVIDISDYLYTIIKENSMKIRKAINRKPDKNQLYKLKVDIELKSDDDQDRFNGMVLKLLDCKDFNQTGSVLTMNVFGTRIVITQTHTFNNKYYYTIKTENCDNTDPDYTAIDISKFFLSLLNVQQVF